MFYSRKVWVPSRPRCNDSCIDNLGLTTAPSGTGLLKRYHKIRAVPRNQRKAGWILMVKALSGFKRSIGDLSRDDSVAWKPAPAWCTCKNEKDWRHDLGSHWNRTGPRWTRHYPAEGNQHHIQKQSPDDARARPITDDRHLLLYNRHLQSAGRRPGQSSTGCHPSARGKGKFEQSTAKAAGDVERWPETRRTRTVSRFHAGMKMNNERSNVSQEKRWRPASECWEMSSLRWRPTRLTGWGCWMRTETSGVGRQRLSGKRTTPQ